MDNLSLYKDFKINLNVSRETCNDLEKYIDLLIDQNKVINLISRKNQNKDFIRKRHIIDSMQIVDLTDFIFPDLNIRTKFSACLTESFFSIILFAINSALDNPTRILAWPAEISLFSI